MAVVAPPPTTTAILLQTHAFDRGAQRLHSALQRACGPNETLFVLMHAPPGSSKPAELDGVRTHFVTTPEIRTADFPRKSTGERWAVWTGHTDLIALHFGRNQPHFDYYWVIEYDVRLSGLWSRFFARFVENKADLLTTTVREAKPDWVWWSSLTDPAGRIAAKPGMLCAFMPIFRFSRAALTEMERRYREGWSGHTEMTWPTFLSEAGLVVEDIGGNGSYVGASNVGRVYVNQPVSWNLGPGTLVWRPARLIAGFRRNLLYHPIKPPMTAIRDKLDYQRTSLRRRLGDLRRRAHRLLNQVSGRNAV